MLRAVVASTRPDPETGPDTRVTARPLPCAPHLVLPHEVPTHRHAEQPLTTPSPESPVHVCLRGHDGISATRRCTISLHHRLALNPDPRTLQIENPGTPGIEILAPGTQQLPIPRLALPLSPHSRAQTRPRYSESEYNIGPPGSGSPGRPPSRHLPLDLLGVRIASK